MSFSWYFDHLFLPDDEFTTCKCCNVTMLTTVVVVAVLAMFSTVAFVVDIAQSLLRNKYYNYYTV